MKSSPVEIEIRMSASIDVNVNVNCATTARLLKTRQTKKHGRSDFKRLLLRDVHTWYPREFTDQSVGKSGLAWSANQFQTD
jgi:hypothetical protein